MLCDKLGFTADAFLGWSFVKLSVPMKDSSNGEYSPRKGSVYLAAHIIPMRWRRRRSSSVGGSGSNMQSASTLGLQEEPSGRPLQTDDDPGEEKPRAQELEGSQDDDFVLEVLVAQNEVFNYLRNNPGADCTNVDGTEIQLLPWPGEWRFLGGRQFEDDRSPLETAVSHLLRCCPCVDMPAFSQIDATLFSKTVVSKMNKTFHAFTFVATEEENDFVSHIDTSKINAALRERRKAYWAAVRDGSFATMAPQQRQQMATRIHAVEWQVIDDLVNLMNPRRRFVNNFQRRHFARHKVSNRTVSQAALNLLVQFKKLKVWVNVKRGAFSSVVPARCFIQLFLVFRFCSFASEPNRADCDC